MPVAGLDVILALIMLVSGFLAMVRGLTREVLSILSWAVAAVATLYLFPKYEAQARTFLEPPLPELAAKAVFAGGIFLIVLIIVSLITARISDRVLDSRIGALDRTLGFIFGLARGLVLVVIAYLFFSWLVPERDQPEWILQAKSLPVIKSTGEAIVSLLPDNPASHLPGQKKEEGDPPLDQPVPPDQRSQTLGGPRLAGFVDQSCYGQGALGVLDRSRGHDTI